MAEIRNYPLLSHLRAEANTYILRYRRGKLVASGRGLTFWFRRLSTGLAEVPLENQEVHFVFHGRSSDFQDISVQGVVTYRVEDAQKVAERVNFTLDAKRGVYRVDPLENLSLSITQLAQQFAGDYLVTTPVQNILREGSEQIRERVAKGLSADPGFGDMGLLIVSVRVSAIKPDPDLEKAIEAPVREQIQQRADEAAFERRALAVQKERAIRENELVNQIELARREEELIQQQGTNSRRQKEQEAEAAAIEAKGQAERQTLDATARAEATRLGGDAEAGRVRAVEGAKAETERARMGAYKDLPGTVLWSLAARELAGKLERIDHLNLSPEMLGPLLANLMEAGTRRLGADSDKE